MNFEEVLVFLVAQFPVLNMIFMILGSLVIIGTVVDALSPKLDFMDKILSVPVLGDVLKALKRFSPFNIKEQEKKELPKE
jgi:hypothetical protein